MNKTYLTSFQNKSNKISNTDHFLSTNHAPERNKTNKTKSDNQSKRKRTFESHGDVKKNCNQAEVGPIKRPENFKTVSTNQNLNSNSNSPPNLPLLRKELDREYFHWVATAEVMEAIRRKRKSPETLRLVERSMNISRPGPMRRKFGMNAQ